MSGPMSPPGDPAWPLFYARPRVLQPALHGSKSLAAATDLRFAAATNAVPLVAGEFAAAGRHYPIVFTAQAPAHPVAIVGLRPQQNLFVDGAGQWHAGCYVPAYVRRYPFVFLAHDGGATLTLCIDEAAPHLVEGTERPLFDAQGQATALTHDALVFCRDYEREHQDTTAFAQAVRSAELLVEHRAGVTLHDGRTLSLSGFQVIDEARFQALPDAEFLRWRRKGWLGLVYAHLASVGNWSALVDRCALAPEPSDG
jgi:hypothetical protein